MATASEIQPMEQDAGQGPQVRCPRPGLQHRHRGRLDRSRLQPGGHPGLRGGPGRPPGPGGGRAGLHPDAVLLDRLQRAEQGRPGLRDHVHLGERGRSGRRPAGRAAGASWPPTSWSWPAWRRWPGSTCSCCSAPTASARTRPAAGCCWSASCWIIVMTYICYRGIEVSANFQKASCCRVEVVMLLVLSVTALVRVGTGHHPPRSVHPSISWLQPVPPRRLPGLRRRHSSSCCSSTGAGTPRSRSTRRPRTRTRRPARRRSSPPSCC